MHKKIILCKLFLLLAFTGFAQDTTFARRIIDTLTTPTFAGRGYVDGTDKAAADFIAAEFQQIGLQSLTSLVQGNVIIENYLQPFELPVNTFPGKMTVRIDGRELQPGQDYLVSPASAGANKKTLQTVELPQKAAKDVDELILWGRKSKLAGKALVVREAYFDEKGKQELLPALRENPFKAGAVIIVQESRLVWSVSQEQKDFPLVMIDAEIFPKKAKKIYLDIEAEHHPNYQTQNVIGYIPGKTTPDSFIVITGHYDHLGRMGSEVFFPGGNDNASGIAIILDLARHYSKPENQPGHSIMFIAFGAEEAGLVGSKYYTENPLFPLNQIAFLLNLDLMGSGEDGMTAVNGSVFKEPFNKLVEINKKNNYLPEIKERGKAANSDHYFFSEKGVQAFFFYQMGLYKHYHDVHDVGELTLAGYHGTFNLITDFVKYIEQR